MGEDEKFAVPAPPKQFGSLANAESVNAILNAAQKSQGSTVSLERMEVSNQADSRHDAEMLAEFDRRRRARTLTLPTDDVQVKLKLRALNQPICLFGEDALDRRERLRALLSTMSEDEIAAVLHTDEHNADKNDEETVTWYHRGPVELRKARVAIADFSLRKAKLRLEKAREDAAQPSHEKALARQEAHKWVQQINLHASQVADTRPVAYCEFSADSKHIVTAGWSGSVAVWKRDQCEKEIKFTGHSAQAGCARFHPGAFVQNDNASLNLVSCSYDGTVLLWSLAQETPIGELEKHPQRVSKVAFHPNGLHLATACFDSTWRMYDLTTRKELLFQEGHSKSVADVAFHPDGSVALTGGHDCYGRVWDMRTGRCIMFLDGHTKEIHSVEWMPNGYEMITGSSDNSMKVWDLRMRRNTYTMPAHTSVVTRVRASSAGQYLVSASFDCTLKMWSTTGWQPLRQLQGHDTRILCVDISPDGQWMCSSAFDRTFKLWAQSDY
ncbi:CRE-PRP-4 protein [Caenorhabditis remanei]|uniref:CRE-PRP-4 protein n=1 Tax=Caenorhabditis remanei TaxID=31234 RepID=E3LVK8_CAERE|nr:CRE-PRP-4 protein [Caenorhabditis remanei]